MDEWIAKLRAAPPFNRQAEAKERLMMRLANRPLPPSKVFMVVNPTNEHSEDFVFSCYDPFPEGFAQVATHICFQNTPPIFSVSDYLKDKEFWPKLESIMFEETILSPSHSRVDLDDSRVRIVMHRRGVGGTRESHSPEWVASKLYSPGSLIMDSMKADLYDDPSYKEEKQLLDDNFKRLNKIKCDVGSVLTAKGHFNSFHRIMIVESGMGKTFQAVSIAKRPVRTTVTLGINADFVVWVRSRDVRVDDYPRPVYTNVVLCTASYLKGYDLEGDIEKALCICTGFVYVVNIPPWKYESRPYAKVEFSELLSTP